jgi:hypothetical protein
MECGAGKYVLFPGHTRRANFRRRKDAKPTGLAFILNPSQGGRKGVRGSDSRAAEVIVEVVKSDCGGVERDREGKKELS